VLLEELDRISKLATLPAFSLKLEGSIWLFDGSDRGPVGQASGFYLMERILGTIT
jgi:hypothetical protein